MPTPTKGPRLGGGPAHERLMLANLAAALFTHKSIKTTETKAKRLRPVAERLITFAKRGDLSARRAQREADGVGLGNEPSREGEARLPEIAQEPFPQALEQPA